MLSPQTTKARVLLFLKKKIILHHSAIHNQCFHFPWWLSKTKFSFYSELASEQHISKHDITLAFFNFSITIAEQTLFLWMLWIHEMIPTDCLSIDSKFHEIQLISARLEYQYIETLQNQIVKAASSLRNTKTLLLH